MIPNKLMAQPGTSYLLAEMIEAWRSYLLSIGGNSENTVDNYRRDVERFLRFSKDHTAKSLTPSDMKNFSITHFRSWLAYERSQGLRPQSLARSLSGLKNFFLGWKRTSISKILVFLQSNPQKLQNHYQDLFLKTR